MWAKHGKNPTGVVTTSINKLLNHLFNNQVIKMRYGSTAKKWLDEKLRIMIGVPLVFESAYKNKDGSFRSKESFTLLKKVEMFDRKLSKINKKDEYAGHSQFVIHPVIIDSILQKNIKPVRLDVILSLKMEISVILYRWLDLVIADKYEVENTLKKLKEELAFGPERYDSFVATIREACEELEGKDFTTGRIVYCKVEKTVDGSDWKIVVRKGKQLELFEEPKVVKQLETDGEFEAFLTKWELLNDPLKSIIKSKAEKIAREKFPTLHSDLSVNLEIVEIMKQREAKPTKELPSDQVQTTQASE
ncbi:MAG: hypothetical protein A3J83_05070 [Elusimicrobia bacterium RIFOXYA2_FULL_40_6]|nr:MAG: hypothetical protein A3J83_05070 [Elusimicrobia bacterium RIFOXYA2_FULL_40_6]